MNGAQMAAINMKNAVKIDEVMLNEERLCFVGAYGNDEYRVASPHSGSYMGTITEVAFDGKGNRKTNFAVDDWRGVSTFFLTFNAALCFVVGEYAKAQASGLLTTVR